MAKHDKKSSSFSELAKKEERLALVLLIPTFVILLVIAIYPLGNVFFSSFTNRQFGTHQPVKFVSKSWNCHLLSILPHLSPK